MEGADRDATFSDADNCNRKYEDCKIRNERPFVVKSGHRLQSAQTANREKDQPDDEQEASEEPKDDPASSPTKWRNRLLAHVRTNKVNDFTDG